MTLDVNGLAAQAIQQGYQWAEAIGISATAAFLAISLIAWLYNR